MGALSLRSETQLLEQTGAIVMPLLILAGNEAFWTRVKLARSNSHLTLGKWKLADGGCLLTLPSIKIDLFLQRQRTAAAPSLVPPFA